MTDPKYPHVIKAVYERPWALRPEMLAVIEELVRFRVEGGRLSEDEIAERIGAASNGPRNGGMRAAGVAVIPMYGVLTQRANLMSSMSGGTSVEQLTAQFRSALADPDVGSIVFDVDSPGGGVDGIEELATEIRNARGQKPMAAVANSQMASAAYWLGSSADEIVVSPSGTVGSIGIFGIHNDISRAQDQAGITTTLVSAGKYKLEGNQHLPLGDEGRAAMQAMADDYYAMFVGAIAKSRGVPIDAVRNGYGEGRSLTAKKALAANMVDRIDTLDATVRRMAWKAQRQPAAAASSASTPLAFSERLELVAAEAKELAAHAQERARLRATEGRAAFGSTNREHLVELASSLGSIRSDLNAVLDTDEPEEVAPVPPATSTNRIGLAVFEAALRGGYRLPSDEVSTP